MHILPNFFELSCSKQKLTQQLKEPHASWFRRSTTSDSTSSVFVGMYSCSGRGKQQLPKVWVIQAVVSWAMFFKNSSASSLDGRIYVSGTNERTMTCHCYCKVSHHIKSHLATGSPAKLATMACGYGAGSIRCTSCTKPLIPEVWTAWTTGDFSGCEKMTHTAILFSQFSLFSLDDRNFCRYKSFIK